MSADPVVVAAPLIITVAISVTVFELSVTANVSKKAPPIKECVPELDAVTVDGSTAKLIKFALGLTVTAGCTIATVLTASLAELMVSTALLSASWTTKTPSSCDCPAPAFRTRSPPALFSAPRCPVKVNEAPAPVDCCRTIEKSLSSPTSIVSTLKSNLPLPVVSKTRNGSPPTPVSVKLSAVASFDFMVTVVSCVVISSVAMLMSKRSPLVVVSNTSRLLPPDS